MVASMDEPVKWRDRYRRAKSFHYQWSLHLGVMAASALLCLVIWWAVDGSGRLFLILPGFLCLLHTNMFFYHLDKWRKSCFMIEQLELRIANDEHSE